MESVKNDPERSVLVTGCSSGIGRAVALGLKKRGYRVFATARQLADVALLEEEGLEALPLDLRDSGSIRLAMKQVVAATGGTLYGLFNNAAYGQPGAVEDLRREVLQEQFETNLFGTHELTTLALMIMRHQGYGRIIHNSSLLGYVALPYRGAYNASKYALEGLTDTLRLELLGSNIHVSLIEPGPISSRFRANAYAAFQRNISPEQSVHRANYQAMVKRFTTPGPVSPFTLKAEAVLPKVIHALENPRPRARYPVTFPAHLFLLLRRCLPGGVLDQLLRWIGEAERR